MLTVVFIKHANSDKEFLFQVPSGNVVKKGEAVLCETMYENTKGVAVCDSFMLPLDAVSVLIRATGAYQPLKHVLGIVKQIEVCEKFGVPF